jgi:hypothetical protein
MSERRLLIAGRLDLDGWMAGWSDRGWWMVQKPLTVPYNTVVRYEGLGHASPSCC